MKQLNEIALWCNKSGVIELDAPIELPTPETEINFVKSNINTSILVSLWGINYQFSLFADVPFPLALRKEDMQGAPYGNAQFLSTGNDWQGNSVSVVEGAYLIWYGH